MGLAETVGPEDAMPLKPEKVQELLNDALQELAEINERKPRLEELVANLQKCLPNPAKSASTAQGVILQPMEIVGTGKVRMVNVRFRRKESHATKIAGIVRRSDQRLKIPDIVKFYQTSGLGLLNTSNGYNIVYRAIKERPDLLTLTPDGYIELVGAKSSSQEVMP